MGPPLTKYIFPPPTQSNIFANAPAQTIFIKLLAAITIDPLIRRAFIIASLAPALHPSSLAAPTTYSAALTN
jgi:hypothetical protein